MTLTIKDEKNVLTGYLEGRLDTTVSAQFGQDMQPLLDNADREIVLDCAALTYISSSGLRHFLSLRKAVEVKGGKLIVTNVSDEIRTIFTITGFYNIFDIR